MRTVTARDIQDDQEVLRSMSDTLIDVRQSAVDLEQMFLAYLIEMAIVELGELQGHPFESVKALDEPRSPAPTRSLDA